MASLSGAIEVDGGAAFTRPAQAEGSVRLVGEDVALEAFPQVWERVRARTPGMLSRSAGWWRIRRVSDPSWVRAGRTQLQRAMLTLEGRPAAYALYRPEMVFEHGMPVITMDVVEAVGDSPAATREIWRYLLSIDLVKRVKAARLPVDHPLLFLMAEQRRLRMRLEDTLWVRIVDVAAALGARSYGEGGALVFDLVDAFCPWNEGRWRLEDGIAMRTSEAAHLALDAEALGSLYLGAFGFTQLAEAGRVVELREGALRRADRLFRADRAPWCPEVF
jgi:predicted acetyltransferase